MNRRGFTLVELLVMMVVLGLLIGITVPNISGIVANQKANAIKDDAIEMVSNAKNKVVVNNMGKPKSGECLVFSLDYLDDGKQIIDGPYGGTYDRNNSYVIYKREASKYKYYVRLVEKLDNGDYGVELTNIDELTSAGASKVGKITSEENIPYDAPIAAVASSSVIQTVCPAGSIRRYNENTQNTTARTPVSFASDSWDTIVNSFKTGTYKGIYNVGDTKDVDLGSLGTQTVRIVNTSPCTTEYSTKTACGIVLEFVNVIEKRAITSTSGLNTGGWANSNLRNYLNKDFYQSLPDTLRSSIIKTKVVSGNGYDDNDRSNFVTKDYIYILTTKEYYGDNEGGDYVTQTKQLDYYKNLNVSRAYTSPVIKKYGGTNWKYWMRSAVGTTTTAFYTVNTNGSVSSYVSASDWSNIGVVPAFRIA